MASKQYSTDVLSDGSHRRRTGLPEVHAEAELVLEDPANGFTGAVVAMGRDTFSLEDRHGARRVYPWEANTFSVEGRLVRLLPPKRVAATAPRQTASGSIAVEGAKARVAVESRIYVEGVHDAELVEKVWGHDLRVEGVVVEPLHGIDDLTSVVRDFAPGPGRRLGVLVDHLVPGSKESRIVATVTSPHVLVTGHPYVDIWQAVKPSSVGVAQWPVVPHGQPWKEGVCEALGAGDPPAFWRHLLGRVTSYRDLETPLLGAVERLIDFVTASSSGATP